MMTKLGFLIALAVIVISQQNNCGRVNILPMPKTIQCGSQTVMIKDPCKILYQIKSQDETKLQHFAEVIGHQQLKTFSCKYPNIAFKESLAQTTLIGFQYKVVVELKDYSLKNVFATKDEAYTLNISQKQAIIKGDTYVSFVRGLQTFIQTLVCPRFKNKNCQISKIPVVINDQPAFSYRGLMVDSSRHFLPKHLILETIDAMMYNKLSVLHWHITDEDSFPLILQSHPQLAKHASYSPEQTYTSDDAREIVRYARVRGVRVVPQLDTPGHAASWGLAPENQGVACTFGTGFMGPLDVTLEKTYKLVKQVFAEIIDIFPDPIIHLGGDEVSLTCMANKTDFVRLQGIKQQQMQRHYRRKQHKIIKELSPQKKPMYWMNQNRIQIQEGDVVHWWGGGLPATTNEVVISQYGPFYLDMGVGNYLGVSYGNYQTWLDLYNLNIGAMVRNYGNKDKVLGAEVCLWSELSNQYVHHMKIWIRSSSFAERVWNIGELNAKPQGLGRVAAHQRLMNRRGIPTAGATSQQCQTFPQFC